MHVFERLESEVRSYCRSWPTVFNRAEGDYLYSEDGTQYVDFFAGAGVLAYGHNNPAMKEKLIAYLTANGITHGLDMATSAKRRFLERFDEVILKPRAMEYKIQFTGPTGTNAVEAALKLARKVTGRPKIVSFTNGFHGMTLGSLALAGNAKKRRGAGVPLGMGISMPYDGYLGPDVDTVAYLRRYLEDSSSGLDKPAAVILETVQVEGGMNVARFPWLQRLATLCKEHGILLIVDDVQVGCGRTGTFFSFEPAGIKPDIICLSKAISGYGLPLSIVLIKPEFDIWEPGEHNATFRGNNPAFVTGTEALRYWETGEFAQEIARKASFIESQLSTIASQFPQLDLQPRGRGMIRGIRCSPPDLAKMVAQGAFERGLIMWTCGRDGEVVEVVPPLTVGEQALKRGFAILDETFSAIAARQRAPQAPASARHDAEAG